MQLTLSKPIILTSGATPIEELTLREEICAGDMRFLRVGALADPTVDDLLTLAGRLTGQGAAVLNKLSLGDMDVLLAEVLGFLVVGRGTGSKQ
jgi:hypothetical protein